MKQKIYTTRPVTTVFYRNEDVIKTNHSAHPNNAVCNAIKHMQVNEYDATHCEVYGGDTGKLYAVIKWGHKEITILYRAKIDDFHTSAISKEMVKSKKTFPDNRLTLGV